MKFMQDLVVDILRDNKKSLSVNEITAIASDLKGRKNRSTTNYALIKLIESSVVERKAVVGIGYVYKLTPDYMDRLRELDIKKEASLMTKKPAKPTDKHVICQKGSLTYVRKSLPPLQHGKIADIHNRMNAMLVAVRA
ncbi:TPA: hypothetical protein ON725_000656 [Proteus mirabilis]|uniref:hypothetical protein n=1 Tax=Proteus TaxID=583 RepID=UPI0013784981|nr:MULTISPECIES: hypothetical protein [Proteus]MBG3043593.1 hypothetical protein [Proteus mirabilis]MBG3051092.1 hypothetical protein [Proteus mirabilis]MCR1830205.1 hypothetical protein [Proteus mirabilis]MDM3701020.1 hypothetical protein [Proteus mirabilis]NBL84417.1 hypothetical protein [Proteus sp. G2674]